LGSSSTIYIINHKEVRNSMKYISTLKYIS